MKILISGAGGFIGGHLVNNLLSQGYEVIAVDTKNTSDWWQLFNSERITNKVLNLKSVDNCKSLFNSNPDIDRVYNLACNMGGLGFIQNNHLKCLENSFIQINLISLMHLSNCREIFFSSSACVYPQSIQSKKGCVNLKESDAFPAEPEDGYGWEKLYSEIFTNYAIKELNINPRIFRFHACYGPNGTWNNGKEKVPAAICRKIIEAKLSGNHEIEVWGDGTQERSFMFIDDCIDGINRIWNCDYTGPVNLGSDEMVTINQLIDIVEGISGIKVKRNYDTSKPIGAISRNSDNTLINKLLNWEPNTKLQVGMEKTYKWIHDQILK